MRWLLRLYPKAWRDRYGEEFLTLLEECQPSLLDRFDIALGALDARLNPGIVSPPMQPVAAPLAMTTTDERQQLSALQRRIDQMSRAPQPSDNRMSRRFFLRNAVLGSVGLLLAEVLAGIGYFFWPNKTGTFGSKIIVPATRIPEVGAPPISVQEGRFRLINNEDGVLALYWKCPHLGCTVPWDRTGSQFACPCHGSVFDRQGVLIKGPAPRPMDIMAVEMDQSGNLIVNTGDIRERGAYDPSQATRLDPPQAQI